MDPVPNAIPELIHRWKCDQASCKNIGNQCLVMHKVHHPLNSSHMNLWNRAIQDRRATVDSPPLTVRPNPIVSKNNPTSESTSPTLPSNWTQLPVQYIHHPYPPPYHSSNLPYYNSTPLSPKSISMHPDSSPVSSGTNNAELLTAYIAWMTARTPSEAEILAKALEKLVDECYDLETIKTMSQSDWAGLEIPSGLGKRLSGNIKRFRKERKNVQ